jgi:hypothetical protein
MKVYFFLDFLHRLRLADLEPLIEYETSLAVHERLNTSWPKTALDTATANSHGLLIFGPLRRLELAQHGALHKHLHPPAQLRLRLDQARTATAQGRGPSRSTSTSGSSPSAQSSSVPFLGLAVF